MIPDFETIEELRKVFIGKGHRDFPLLSSSYSPSARVPVTDFSRWLQRQIERNDFETVATWAWEIEGGLAPLVMSIEGQTSTTAISTMGETVALQAGLNESQLQNIRQLFELDLGEHFEDLPASASLELKSCLLISQNADVCAIAMCPYDLRPYSIFYWAEKPEPIDYPRGDDVRLLRETLSSFPLSGRMLFFDTCNSMSMLPSTQTKKTGIVLENASELLRGSGLFEPHFETVSYKCYVEPETGVETNLDDCTKSDLTVLLQKAGIQSKKSWPKSKLYQTLGNKNPDRVFIRSKRLEYLRLKPEHAAAYEKLSCYVEGLTSFFSAWLPSLPKPKQRSFDGYPANIENEDTLYREYSSKFLSFLKQARSQLSLIAEAPEASQAGSNIDDVLRDAQNYFKSMGQPLTSEAMLLILIANHTTILGQDDVRSGKLFSDTGHSIASSGLLGQTIARLSMARGENLEVVLKQRASKLFHNLISDTITNFVSNKTSRDGAVKSRVFTHKIWLTMRDDKVRDGHAALDGQMVAMDEPFCDEVTKEMLMYPGDPSAKDGRSVLACRCTIIHSSQRKGGG